MDISDSQTNIRSPITLIVYDTCPKLHFHSIDAWQLCMPSRDVKLSADQSDDLQ